MYVKEEPEKPIILIQNVTVIGFVKVKVVSSFL